MQDHKGSGRDGPHMPEMEEDFEQGLERDVPRGLHGEEGRLVEAGYLDDTELSKPEWGYRNADGDVAGLVLGYRNGRAVGVMDDRHALLVVGSRGGKGVSQTVPNALTYSGSMIVIDPKGELARITAGPRMAMGHPTSVIDAWGENGIHPTSSFNPLAEIDPDDVNAADDAALVAEALITSSERDPHWGDSGRIVTKGAVLFTLTLPEEERHLITVRKLVMLTHPAIDEVVNKEKCDRETALFLLFAGCKEPFGGVVAGIGEAFARMADRERASIMSTVRSQTEWLDSAVMEKVLTRSDFKLADLKTGRRTVYLCLPASRMGTHYRWLRVILTLCIVVFERVKEKPKVPVLMVLEEFAVLGHMRPLEVAAGLMAGFGVKLWIILQDLSQLKKHYKGTWETFIGNAGVMVCWANTDHTTLEYVSKKAGQMSVRLAQPSGATPAARLGGASAVREELRVQRLLAPHEVEIVLARHTRRALVMVAGRPPIILKRIRYYEDKAFKSLLAR